MIARITNTYDGRAVGAKIGEVAFTVTLATGVVGWADDWTVDGTVLTWGRNYGPAAFGHTDAVLTPAALAAVQTTLASGNRVVRVNGFDDYLDPGRTTVTWQVFMAGELLGNAVDEEEGYRWIADMERLHARKEESA